MKNYKSSGKTMQFTAPTGGVTSGAPVLIGATLVIPVASADETVAFAGETQGVFEITKAASQAWTEGEVVYWDDGNSRFTDTDATGLFRAGVAAEAAASGAALTTGVVRLDGISVTASA